MKNLLLLFLLMSISSYTMSQSISFEEETDVISYMDGKRFYNESSGLEIEYGYISSYNTYGIKVKNNSGEKFYFINVEISTSYDGRYADLYGMSAETGSNFGFRLFKGKLVVGYGESGAQTFYEK
jgi:hypothetical protein